MQDFALFIEKNFSSHTHTAIALRIIELLSYVESNLEKVAAQAQVGKQSLFRHPTNHLALHLNDYKNAEEAKQQLVCLITEVKGSFAWLLNVSEPLRTTYINCFLLNINDSEVGCMEARLRPALVFVGLQQSIGLLSLDNLMMMYQSVGDKAFEVGYILDFFSDKIEHGLLVLNPKQEIEALDWQKVKSYLKEVLYFDSIEADWLAFGRENKPLIVERQGRKMRWHDFYFGSEDKANRYLSYLKSILPLQYQAELAKANVKKGANQFQFSLTHQQYLTSQEILADRLMQPEKFNWLIKSVRWDESCFIESFILSITKSPLNQHHEELRRGMHKTFTVFASGVYPRNNKPSPYPMENMTTKKQERSTHQALSLVTPDSQTPVFGHNKERGYKLVAFLFDPKDALVNRVFKYDGGTVDRPYEANDMEEAREYFKSKVQAENPILFPSLAVLAQAIKGKKGSYNEVLARVRWQTENGKIAICSDSFETRCVAQYYAYKLHNRIKQQSQELGQTLDPQYQVPIVYYLPETPKHWQAYTLVEQQADQVKANTIFNNLEQRRQAFAENNYEFLLLIDKPEDIFEPGNKSILVELFIKCQWQMIAALFERAQLQDYMVEYLISLLNNYPRLDFFRNLNKEGKSLLYKASIAKQLQFVEIILRSNIASAAYINDALTWPNGSTALHWAANAGHTQIVKLLIDAQASTIATNQNGSTALHLAAWKGHIEIIKLLINAKASINETNQFGATALHCAARHGHTGVVKLLINSQTNINARDKEGLTALHWAAWNGHIEIIKLLIDAKADINATDKEGRTALHWAAWDGHTDVVKLFYKANMNIFEQKLSMPSPLQLAQWLNHRNTCQFFFKVMITNYIFHLSQCKEEHKTYLHRFFGLGYTTQEKMRAAQALLTAVELVLTQETLAVIAVNDLSILRSGPLGEITRKVEKVFSLQRFIANDSAVINLKVI